MALVSLLPKSPDRILLQAQSVEQYYSITDPTPPKPTTPTQLIA